MRWIFATLLAVNVLIFLYFQFSDTASINAPAFVALDDTMKNNDSPPDFGNDASSLSDSLVLLDEEGVLDKGFAAGIDNIQPDSIRIVSEFSDKQVVSSAEPSVEQLNSEVPLCSLVGEFTTLLKAEYFLERLMALGLQAEIKSLVVSSKVSFWLYLPPEASRKEALRRLSELKRQGVDSYVIPKGNLANGISIGLYSRKDRAELVKDSIVKLGYTPKVEAIARDKKEIWVFLPEGEASKISPERWSELLSGKDLLQKRQNLCSDVASGSNFL